MASSENVFYEVFPIEGTVNNRGIILYVREKYFDNNVALNKDTLLSNFMSDKDIEKGTAITQGFGNYVYSKQLDKEGNMLRFLFLPVISQQQSQIPFNSYYNLEPSMFWPKVLLSTKAYRRATDSSYIVRFKYKEAYQGPTRVLVEEFYSPNPFEIPIYTPMVERGLNEEIGVSYYNGLAGPYWLSVGTLSLDSCLHSEISLTVPLEPPVNLVVGGVTIIISTASVSDPATNYTDWPDSLVIDDRQQEVFGGWIRKRVTAYRPMIIYVTLPTVASLTSSSVTLGGTIAIEDNAIVASRGVVYSRVSLNANPFVGDTHATSVSTSGTVGTFTIPISGLLSNTAYSFKPWALTAQGARVYGPLGNFTTAA